MCIRYQKAMHQATYYCYSHPQPHLPVFVKLHEHDLTARGSCFHACMCSLFIFASCILLLLSHHHYRQLHTH